MQSVVVDFGTGITLKPKPQVRTSPMSREGHLPTPKRKRGTETPRSAGLHFCYAICRRTKKPTRRSPKSDKVSWSREATVKRDSEATVKIISNPTVERKKLVRSVQYFPRVKVRKEEENKN